MKLLQPKSPDLARRRWNLVFGVPGRRRRSPAASVSPLEKLHGPAVRLWRNPTDRTDRTDRSYLPLADGVRFLGRGAKAAPRFLASWRRFLTGWARLPKAGGHGSQSSVRAGSLGASSRRPATACRRSPTDSACAASSIWGDARHVETSGRLKLDATAIGGQAARQFPVESAVMRRTRPALHVS